MIEMYGYYREGYEFFPGRRVVLLKIKNKSRFVTVSFLLASLVTVISSASAEETVDFLVPFTVEADSSCSDDDVPASWAPENISGAIVVNPSDDVTVTVDPNFEHGFTGCPDYSLNTTGYVISTLTVPDDWISSTECHTGNPCTADPLEREVQGYFTVPSDADLGDYFATFTLTWMTP
jgi:hypothetical protein